MVFTYKVSMFDKTMNILFYVSAKHPQGVLGRVNVHISYTVCNHICTVVQIISLIQLIRYTIWGERVNISDRSLWPDDSPSHSWLRCMSPHYGRPAFIDLTISFTLHYCITGILRSSYPPSTTRSCIHSQEIAFVLRFYLLHSMT